MNLFKVFHGPRAIALLVGCTMPPQRLWYYFLVSLTSETKRGAGAPFHLKLTNLVFKQPHKLCWRK